LVADEHFEVITTYHKECNAEEKSVKSKLFFDRHKPAGDRKAQFVWPFKAGYWTIELATDYSYVVICALDLLKSIIYGLLILYFYFSFKELPNR
jgi:lipocalin